MLTIARYDTLKALWEELAVIKGGQYILSGNTPGGNAPGQWGCGRNGGTPPINPAVRSR